MTFSDFPCPNSMIFQELHDQSGALGNALHWALRTHPVPILSSLRANSQRVHTANKMNQSSRNCLNPPLDRVISSTLVLTVFASMEMGALHSYKEERQAVHVCIM